jgi:hypothetical protein
VVDGGTRCCNSKHVLSILEVEGMALASRQCSWQKSISESQSLQVQQTTKQAVQIGWGHSSHYSALGVCLPSSIRNGCMPQHPLTGRPYSLSCAPLWWQSQSAQHSSPHGTWWLLCAIGGNSNHVLPAQALILPSYYIRLCQNSGLKPSAPLLKSHCPAGTFHHSRCCTPLQTPGG